MADYEEFFQELENEQLEESKKLNRKLRSDNKKLRRTLLLKNRNLKHSRITVLTFFILVLFSMNLFVGLLFIKESAAVVSPTWSVSNTSPASSVFLYDCDTTDTRTFSGKTTVENNDPSSITFNAYWKLYYDSVEVDTGLESLEIASGNTEDITFSTSYDLWDSTSDFGSYAYYFEVNLQDTEFPPNNFGTKQASSRTIYVVDYASHSLNPSVNNPDDEETFLYTHTSESFSYAGWLGITAGSSYDISYDVEFFIDGSSKASDSASGSSITELTFDPETYGVDISTYDVGPHTAKLVMSSITITITGSVTIPNSYEQNNWHREAPNDPPTISISSPTAYQQYNRSSDTSISTTATITDPETSLDAVQVYWDNNLNRTWTSPANGEKTHSIAINNETATGNHIIAWFTNDTYGNEVWENITIVIYAGNTQIIILDPDVYYLNSMGSVTFYTTDADGLNNLSFKVRQDLGQFNISDSIVSQICNASYDKLIEVAGYYETSVCYVEYTKIQKWVEDSFVDDNGTKINGDATNSNGGWSWVTGPSDYVDRADGYMELWGNVAGSSSYVKCYDQWLYAYGLGYPEVFWEIAIKPNETANKYDFIDYNVRLGSNYFHMTLYPNDTLSVGVTNGGATGTWYSLTQESVTFTKNQLYIFRVTAGSSWIAYQYSLGSGFTTVRNSTSDYTNYYGYPNYFVISVDNAVGQTNISILLDYLKSGWADWQTGTYAEVGLSETTTTIDDQSYYLNITSTQACRIWTTIQTESNKIFVNISDTYIFSVYTGSAGTEDTTVYSNFTNLFSELSEGIFYINISLNNDLNYNFSLIQSFYKDITAPNIEIIKPLSYTIRIYEVGEPIELLYNATYQDFELIVYEYIYLNGYYQSILSNGDVFYRATGLHEMVVFVIDEAGNSNSTSIVFEVVEFSQCQITYLDTFQNPLNFERFDTYVNTSRYSRYNELDSFVSLETDDNITIETYNRDGYQLSSATYSYAERLYIDLSVHFIQWQNTNISTTVQVFISWSFDYYGSYQNSLNFTLAEGMISEELMIYADAYYFIQYNDSSGLYKKHNIGPILGSELINYKIGINMSEKLSLWTTFQNILSVFSMIISPIFALMAVNRYRNQDKKNFWIWAVMAILFGVLVLGMNQTVTMQTTTWMYLGIVAIGFLAYVVYKKRSERKTDFGGNKK